MPNSLSLDRLPLGCPARVLSLDFEVSEKRRLMDLGLLPGALVRACFRSPLGDPTAYELRGATLALRREQAARIQVMPVEGEGDVRPSSL